MTDSRIQVAEARDPETDPSWNQSLLYPCLGDLVDEAAAKWGSRIALYMPDGEMTFEDVAREVRQDAARLFASGVRYGDTVVTILDNNLDAITLWLGTNVLGAIHVPISTAFKGEYLRHHIETSEAKVVFCEADLLDRLDAILVHLPAVKTVVVRGVDQVAREGPVDRISLADWRRGFVADSLPVAPKPTGSDVAALIFTSGTTGASKAVMISHSYFQHAAAVHGTFIRPIEATLYLPFRMGHFAIPAWFVETLMNGAPLAVPATFSVSGFWKDVNRVGAAVTVAVSSMAQLLVNAPESDDQRNNDTMQKFFVAPCSSGLRSALEERFAVSVSSNGSYGLTEAVSIVVQDPRRPSPPGSSGKADPRYWVVKIFDDEDQEVAANEVGEIVCRPLARGVMMNGYWHRPADTLAVMRNLWFHTGDLGKMDADGNMFFVDRKKDYLRYRGENISSVEVETQFLAHPALLEAAVHAVRSPLGEDDLKLTAVLRDGATLSERDLAEWSIERLPYFAVPRYIEFRQQLPKNQMNKVQKNELRDQGVTASTWDMSTSDVRVSRR